MKTKDIIRYLQEHGVRMSWMEKEERWYLSVRDVIGLLTESKHPGAYWQSLKKRLKKEGYSDTDTCKMRIPDVRGKKKMLAMISLGQFFRLVQSVRTPQAEDWRMWLIQAGEEEVRETYDPERGLDRALENWRRMGRDEKWILQRMMSQGTRSRLTQYWGAHGIRESEEFRSLTNRIHEGWSGITIQEHKELKGLRSQNLRDHMTEAELIFMALAEIATYQIAENRHAMAYKENAVCAGQGAGIAGEARKTLEKYTGSQVVSEENFRSIKEEKKKK